MEGFPGGAVVENLPANVGDTGLSPGLGRSHMLHGVAKKKNVYIGGTFWSEIYFHYNLIARW